MFFAVVAGASALAGAIASVSGFGIGSLLTPIFSLQDSMQVAVAAVSIPHFVATSLRFWMLRRDVDRRILNTFGLMSAAGGLTGALLQRYASGRSLTIVFATLLTFVGVAGLTGWSDRWRLGRTAGWIAGIVSGALGGLVGNQGGIRSAALLGYELSPSAFVATATAAGLIVDVARLPVYVFAQHSRLVERSTIIAIATIGVTIGTIAGGGVLKRLHQSMFRRLVAGLVLALGLYMFTRA